MFNRFIRNKKLLKGSVLILVIVLLLMLTILGTVYLSTSRAGRINAAQNLLNAQADFHAEGVANAASGAIMDDLNDTTATTATPPGPYLRGHEPLNAWNPTQVYATVGPVVFDPANPFNFYTYNNPTPAAGQVLTDTTHWTKTTGYGYSKGEFAVGLGAQSWLAPRLPGVATPTTVAGAGNLPYWTNISGPIGPLIPTLGFEDPVTGTAIPTPPAATFLYPGFNATFTLPTLSQGPAGVGANAPTAADADGDGIADSYLFRIPGAYFDGLTWYAAVRIVDDNSAVNANTAWYSGADFANMTTSSLAPAAVTTAYQNWGFFPSGVDLLGLLSARDTTATSPPAIGDRLPFWNSSVTNTYATNDVVISPIDGSEFLFTQTAANSTTDPAATQNTGAILVTSSADWASNATNGVNAAASIFGYREGNLFVAGQFAADETMLIPPTSGYATSSSTFWIGNGPTSPVRNDFYFLSQGDALNNQLDRRLASPGLNVFTNGSANSFSRYQAIPFGDTAELAANFCLVNPSSSGPQTLLETLLPDSLYWENATHPTPSAPHQTYRSTPYTGAANNDANQWFNDNFLFDNKGLWITTTTYAANDVVISPTDGMMYQTPAGGALGDPGLLTNGVPTNSGWISAHIPLRSILVTHNPVSNYINPVTDTGNNNPGEPINTIPGIADATLTYGSGSLLMTGKMMLPYGVGNNYTGSVANYNHYKGQWLGSPLTPYAINDIVLYAPANPGSPGFGTPTPTAPGMTFICVKAPPSSNPPATYSGGYLTVNYLEWQLQPWSPQPTKANVNTATFRELFRAFWSVMAGAPSNTTPFGDLANAANWNGNIYATSPANPWHQFRTPLRDASPNATANNIANLTWMNSTNVMLLRAALAAVNTLGLRDQTQDVISRSVYLMANVNPTANASSGSGPSAPVAVQAMVYSSAPQPFITEVYADNDNAGVNPKGYVAIELYNPYNQTINLNNWQIACIDRTINPSATATYPNMHFELTGGGLSTIGPPSPANITMLPHSFALLENYSATAGGNDAHTRSVASGLSGGLPVGMVDVFVTNLSNVIVDGAGNGGEMVILRPRRADGVLTSCSDPLNFYQEITTGASPVPNLVDWVPVDSFDFSGITTTAGTGAWSYLRNKGIAAPDPLASPPGPATMNENFRGVYPGAYSTAFVGGGRQALTDNEPITSGTGTLTVGHVWAGGCQPAFGASTDASDAGTLSETAPPIQIYNKGMPGPKPVFTPGTNTATYTGPAAPTTALTYPFGTFARNGDMLDIPYIGSYRIQTAQVDGALAIQVGSVNFLELNSITMDAAFADDMDSADDGVEPIGRFVPIASRVTSPTPTYDYYGWCKNLFNYLTVQSGNDSWLPQFDPGPYDTVTNATTPTGPQKSATKYPPGSGTAPYANNTTPLGQGSAPFTPANPVYTRDAAATNQTAQHNVGVEGLININTAPWKVLATLPFVTPQEDPTGWQTDNENLAKAIVTWRDGTNGAVGHGPFMSIFDLNMVTDSVTGQNFQNAEGKLTLGPVGAVPAPVSTSGVTTQDGILGPPEPLFPNVTTPPTLGVTTADVAEDFQADNAVLTRISNLITTRSDTFTVYVVVEGWQNAAIPGGPPLTPTSPQPQLKVVRRFAFTADRSAINGDLNTRFLKTMTVPGNN